MKFTNFLEMPRNALKMIDRSREWRDQEGEHSIASCHTEGVDDEVVTVELLDPSARYLFLY